MKVWVDAVPPMVSWPSIFRSMSEQFTQTAVRSPEMVAEEEAVGATEGTSIIILLKLLHEPLINLPEDGNSPQARHLIPDLMDGEPCSDVAGNFYIHYKVLIS